MRAESLLLYENQKEHEADYKDRKNADRENNFTQNPTAPTVAQKILSLILKECY